MGSRQEIKETILEYIEERGREGNIPSIKDLHAQLRELGSNEEETTEVIGEIITSVRNMLRRGEIVESETLVKNLRRLPMPPSTLQS